VTRRKKPALQVPGSIEEATLLCADYVARERDILSIRIVAEQRIDAVKAALALDLARLQPEQEGRFSSLKAWWEAGGAIIAKDRRSTDIAGAKIGTRLTPPKVKLPKGLKVERVVAWLRGVRWTRAKEFLRIKIELDKQALIKAHAADESVRRMFSAQGIGVVQDDEFFIDAGLDEDAVRAALTVPA